MARAAVEALGLIHGGVDIVKDAAGNWFILEVNSSPALNEPNLERWGPAISEYLSGDNREQAEEARNEEARNTAARTAREDQLRLDREAQATHERAEAQALRLERERLLREAEEDRRAEEENRAQLALEQEQATLEQAIREAATEAGYTITGLTLERQ